MIPFIRSLNELMVITQPKNQIILKDKEIILNLYSESDNQSNKTNDKKNIGHIKLPYITKTSRKKWISTKGIMKILRNKIDHEKKMQSSYHLKFVDSQRDYDHLDIA